MTREEDTNARPLVLLTAAVAGVVLIVLALALGEWWLLVPALMVHGVAAALTVGYFGRRAAEGDEPEGPARERVREEQDGEPDLRVQPERVSERVER